ncbi:MAG: hypothetical protein ACR2LE_01365 [Nocardioidaceae bacterium]
MSTSQTVRGGADLRQRRIRWVRLLSWASLVWMCAEGAIGLLAGFEAGSTALVGWALGSVIEGLASVIVIWRFTGRRLVSETSERLAQRGVAVSFFFLAPYIAVQALWDLAMGHSADSTALGIAVAASSVVVMPLLGLAKRRLGSHLDSDATTGEGLQNLMCAAQAATVLVGLGVTAVIGWSWVDPAIALIIAGWAVWEGVAAWREDGCC